jgi:hypothetical protein
MVWKLRIPLEKLLLVIIKRQNERRHRISAKGALGILSKVAGTTVLCRTLERACYCVDVDLQ